MVRIAGRQILEEFREDWQFHDPLTPEQLLCADRSARVAGVGFYHGGDPLYSLENIPGVWHECCLLLAQYPG